MKVLHVVPYVSLLYGGPPVAVAQMATTLAGLGVEVDVVTTTANGIAELDVPTGRPVVKNRVRYFYFRRRGLRFLMFSWSLRSWLYRHAHEYDVVHVHCAFAYTTLLGCAAAILFGRPYLITPHGMLDPWSLSQKWWKKCLYFYFLERRNLLRASAVHVTSSFEASGIAKLGFAVKTHIIPLSVDVRTLQRRYWNNDQYLTLLFFSRLDRVKGLPLIFQAMALLRERVSMLVVLKIVGHGGAEYVSELKKIANKFRILENIKFEGYLQGAAKWTALNEADVFVLPSYHENFSLATAEAMASGLPVVVSDQVGLAQEISEASAGIVVPSGSPEALADAIEAFMCVKRRQICGENGRNLMLQKFSRERLGRSLLNVYEDMLKQSDDCR